MYSPLVIMDHSASRHHVSDTEICLGLDSASAVEGIATA